MGIMDSCSHMKIKMFNQDHFIIKIKKQLWTGLSTVNQKQTISALKKNISEVGSLEKVSFQLFTSAKTKKHKKLLP